MELLERLPGAMARAGALPDVLDIEISLPYLRYFLAADKTDIDYLTDAARNLKKINSNLNVSRISVFGP